MTARHVAVWLGLVLTTIPCGRPLAQAPPLSPATAPGLSQTGTPSSPAAKSPTSLPGYDRKGRRDPFQPLEAAQGTVLTVASARLRGILRGSFTRALLETPDGIGYIMKPGDTLGEARLVEIGTDSVVFRVPPRRGSTTDRLVLRLSAD